MATPTAPLGNRGRSRSLGPDIYGRLIDRPVGFAMIYAGGRATPTIVVFGKSGEKPLLGAIGLEGMNLRVDLVRRELVPAGPVPVAAAA